MYLFTFCSLVVECYIQLHWEAELRRIKSSVIFTEQNLKDLYIIYKAVQIKNEPEICY
jgi:hypothetical protein